jgi:hypothetical protein
MAYAAGQDIEVAFTAMVLSETAGPLSTTRVREEGGPGNGTIHCLYLGTADSRKQVLGDPLSGKPGELIKVRFLTTIPGTPVIIRDGLTKVEVRDSPAGQQYYHYLNLDSPSITPVPAPGTRDFPPGTTVRAAFTGVITDASFGQPLGTWQVKDDQGFTHRLYLSADSSYKGLTGMPKPFKLAEGDTITVNFTATLLQQGERGFTTPKLTAGNGTAVRSEGSNGVPGFNHYLDLASPNITLASKPATPEPATSTTAILPVRAIEPDSESGAAIGITPRSVLITSAAVNARIADLENLEGFEIVRNRDGEAVLTEAGSEQECTRYLDDEDLNPARFTIRHVMLGAELDRELRLLRDLASRAASELGGSTWTLREEGFFTESWAQDEALEALGNRADLTAWPLNLIDWDGAAEELRDADWTAISFDGAGFYGKAS